MTRTKISLRSSRVTDDQAQHHRELSLAIDDALQTGLRIPCVEDPKAFDDATLLTRTARPCEGCPVVELCEAYGRTGAVTHGVLANDAMSDPRNDRRRELRTARRTSAAARHSAA